MSETINPVFAPIEDNPNLPRVLIIGDSISIGYTLAVRLMLKDLANLHRPLTNCGPTNKAIDALEQWLGTEPWDVIHFNWGLHDIVRMDVDGERVDPPQGQHQVAAEQYEKNLIILVERLKQTGAKLIWCATTPVPVGASSRQPGDELKFNAIAQKIMTLYGIPTNDLYTYAVERQNTIQIPADVHFTEAGSAELAKPVVKHILDALG